MELEIREAGAPSDPVHCTVCGVVVLEPDEPDALEAWDPTPACEHVWGLWHDHGIVYLSPDARRQLAASGVLVHDQPELGIELEISEDPDSGDDRSEGEILTGIIHGPGAAILAVYAGPPSFEGAYIGTAERLG